jgi:polysaccharide pyruvyl transferase WcaK-like protein
MTTIKKVKLDCWIDQKTKIRLVQASINYEKKIGEIIDRLVAEKYTNPLKEIEVEINAYLNKVEELQKRRDKLEKIQEQQKKEAQAEFESREKLKAITARVLKDDF